jgi:hypothetical protein
MPRTAQLQEADARKKTDARAALRAEIFGELLIREAVRQVFFERTGFRTIPRIRPNGKIGLEIVREPVA